MEYDDYNTVLEEILSYSFSLKSADESTTASRSFLSQVRSQRYPSVSLGAFHLRNFSNNSDVEYISQLENNTTNQVAATVSIPIFNRYQTQNTIDNAKVQYLNTQLQNDQTVLNVTNDAQNSYLNLLAAQTSYQTAIDNFEASNQTYEFIQSRFENGNTDFYAYQQALNDKNIAEGQLINAKYTIILRKRILDLYRGR